MHSCRKYGFLLILIIGTFLVYVSCKNKLTPQNPLPEGLQITAPASSIHSGGSLQLISTMTYDDGTSEDVTTEVIWSITPGEAAYIDNNGLFSALNGVTGIETVQADYQGKSASIEIEVVVAVRSLSIWPVRTSVASGKTLQLTAVAEFQDNNRELVNDRVDWSVFPGIAASIDDNGFLHAIQGATGQETVTGSLHNISVQSDIMIDGIVQVPFDMVTIPAGSFIMGDNLGWRAEKPAHEVYLDEFEISRYEITNAEYVDYLNEALLVDEIMVSLGQVVGRKGPFASLTYSMLLGSEAFPDVFITYNEFDTDISGFQAIPGYGNYPVVRVSWYGAAAFCGFYGLRLPTEAEWEKACRGGQQLKYGTQNGSISHNKANYLGIGSLDTYTGPAPVGSFPPNPYGLYEMSGNAAEWVFDAYGSDYYYFSPTQNPTGPGPLFFIGRLPNETALFRGGSWISYPYYCRSVYRGAILDDADLNIPEGASMGFRVARSLD